MLRMILATDILGGIGFQGKLPWHIPEDLKSFKELTTGDIVVMGRNTYDGILEKFPNGLPNRKHYVVTSHGSGLQDNGAVFLTFSELIDCIRNKGSAFHDQDVWLIGGATIYNTLLQFMDEVYLTIVPFVCECDVGIDDETFDKVLCDKFQIDERVKLTTIGNETVYRIKYVRV